MSSTPYTAAGTMQRTSRKRRAPADSPASAFYLPVAKRGKPLPDRDKTNVARLSEDQRRTFLGEAARRVKVEASERKGRWLRSLDCVHLSGRRVRQEVWSKLAAIIEPIMARVDIATLVLGWMDNEGQFHLNLQNGIAVDAEIHQCALSRTLKILEKARYIRREQKRLFHDGKRWITRTMIILRKRLFIELGLAHQLKQARERKKEKRRLKLQEIQRRAQQKVLQQAEVAMAKQARRRDFQVRERIAIENRQQEQQVELNRRRAELAVQLHQQNPSLTGRALTQAVDAFLRQ
ncbi:OmpH family outer membrane protein [Pseudomonas sp. WAC2]|uniref:OmpH family outer membrane protein n=1 Tax=Pseudomonas sp. WAC2 TaxID=3055057 RepID=UPI0025B0D021|nr:OmpH family outer membrane protein [Pseudomonas sp. WAC2]MDN3238024.1 OmpH family outer membrane protein [Pseudomonas sp. WAC2]